MSSPPSIYPPPFPEEGKNGGFGGEGIYGTAYRPRDETPLEANSLVNAFLQIYVHRLAFLLLLPGGCGHSTGNWCDRCARGVCCNREVENAGDCGCLAWGTTLYAEDGTKRSGKDEHFTGDHGV